MPVSTCTDGKIIMVTKSCSVIKNKWTLKGRMVREREREREKERERELTDQ